MYAKFGRDNNLVKKLCFTGNINNGHFEVYLSISDIDVTYNLSVHDITVSENFPSSSQSISELRNSNKRRKIRVRPSKRKTFNFTKQIQEELQKYAQNEHIQVEVGRCSPASDIISVFSRKNSVNIE